MTPDVRLTLEAALPLLEEWQRYTANNIANVDTPGFRPKQVDFKASLQAALAEAPRGLRLARTDGRHRAPRGGVPGLVVTASKETALRTDGNRVDIDYEMTQLARNSYSTVAEMLKNRNRLLRDVLRAN